MLKVLVHLIGVLQFSFSIYYDWRYVNVPGGMPNGSNFGGKFIFLTVWNAIVQSFFFLICLVNDFFGSNEINPKVKPPIRNFKDRLFCSIAFPLSVFVALTFWGLYAIDRELVLPKTLDRYFPSWLNHIMHTNILLFSVVEMVSSFRVYPSKIQGVSILTLFMLLYLTWVFVIYANSGQWVYPIMEVLNWPQRILFFAGLLLLVQGFYLIGDVLNSIVWSQELKSMRTAAGRKKKAH